MAIREQNGKFYAQLGTQSEFEIVAQTDREFFWMTVNARIELIKNADGKITKVVHYQNGQSIVAPKID